MIKATSDKWKALTGKHLKEGYGLSETSPVLCINPMSVTDFTETCGLPVPSTEIKLLDDDRQRGSSRARLAKSAPAGRR